MNFLLAIGIFVAGQCWDDEYEETKEVRKNNASYDIDELEKIK